MRITWLKRATEAGSVDFLVILMTTSNRRRRFQTKAREIAMSVARRHTRCALYVEWLSIAATHPRIHPSTSHASFSTTILDSVDLLDQIGSSLDLLSMTGRSGSLKFPAMKQQLDRLSSVWIALAPLMVLPRWLAMKKATTMKSGMIDASN